MEMINRIITLLIGNYFVSLFSIYCWNKLLKNDRKTSKKLPFLIDILITIINIFINNNIKMIFVCIVLYLIAKKYICSETKKAIILVAFSQIILALSEFTFILMLTIVFGSTWEKYMAQNNIFILSVYITFLSIGIMKTNIPNKIFNIFTQIHNNKKKEPTIYSIIIVIILAITTIESYHQISITVIICTNIIIMTIFIYIIIKSTVIDNKFSKINKKYETSINSIKEYEAMIDKFRVNTHENKNELLTIRNMIKNKDKKIVEYIDTLVDNKIKDNEKIMYQTSKIPEGGLRATIYSKLCVMDKYKIKYKLDISKDVRTVDLINLDEELILNICKILGVFMDNAIEAVKTLKKREINIELYVIDDELFIDITNNFKGDIDLTKIGRERNTSKGENHGYGLLLVNKIINENKKYIENEKSINGNYFTQSLRVKIK